MLRGRARLPPAPPSPHRHTSFSATQGAHQFGPGKCMPCGFTVWFVCVVLCRELSRRREGVTCLACSNSGRRHAMRRLLHRTLQCCHIHLQNFTMDLLPTMVATPDGVATCRRHRNLCLRRQGSYTVSSFPGSRTRQLGPPARGSWPTPPGSLSVALRPIPSLLVPPSCSSALLSWALRL